MYARDASTKVCTKIKESLIIIIIIINLQVQI